MAKVCKDIVVKNGHYTSYLFHTNDSGKVVTRDKVDTLTGVPHPGIIIGNDIWNRVWVAHNHYKNGKPQIELMEKFADGEEVKWDLRQVNFTRELVVARAIYYWKKGDLYSWLSHNCQQFVNIIVKGENFSETIDKFSDMTALAGTTVSVIGLITGDKKDAKVGAIIALAGLGAKAASRKWR